MEMLNRLSQARLSPPQDFPFSGLQALVVQTDYFLPGMSGRPQLGLSGGAQLPNQADSSEHKINMVHVVAADGFPAVVYGTGKAVHSVQKTFSTVYSSGLSNSQSAPVLGGLPPTEDMDVGVSHMTPMPNG